MERRALSGTGAAGDRAWDTPANWENSILPVDGDSLHFPAGDVSAPLLNDMGTLEWVDHIWIDDGYTLNGNAVEVRGGLTVAPFVSTAVYDGVERTDVRDFTGNLGASRVVRRAGRDQRGQQRDCEPHRALSDATPSSAYAR